MLISKAAWKDSTVIFKNQVFDIKRGQIVTSQRKLAADFGWSREKLISFINLLQKNTTITQETSHGFLLITICNYEKYQGFDNDDPPQTGKISTEKPDELPQKTRPNIKNQEKKKKEVIFILPDWIDPNVWEEFLSMRIRKKSPATEYAKQLIVKELDKLWSQHGYEHNEVLNQSIRKNYTDVFPLQDKGKPNGQTYKNSKSDYGLSVVEGGASAVAELRGYTATE